MKSTEPTQEVSGKRPIPSESMSSCNSKEIIDGRSTAGLENTGFGLDICSKEIHPRRHEDMNSSLNFSQAHKGSDRSLCVKRPLPEIFETDIDQSTGQKTSKSFYDQIDEKNKSDCCDPVQGVLTTIYDSIDALASDGNENRGFSSHKTVGKALVEAVNKLGSLVCKNKDNHRFQSDGWPDKSGSLMRPPIQAAQQSEGIGVCDELKSVHSAGEITNEKHGLQMKGQLSPSQELRKDACSPNERRPLPEIPNNDTEISKLSVPNLLKETYFN
eukprot:Seg463.7 transcript_id=Seg463.7/GoldUCD/mRNA.D3Y31 product="hypothetical protein" protein_id=Seg463.7/GoldUCD/D3Y31